MIKIPDPEYMTDQQSTWLEGVTRASQKNKHPCRRQKRLNIVAMGATLGTPIYVDNHAHNTEYVS